MDLWMDGFIDDSKETFIHLNISVFGIKLDIFLVDSPGKVSDSQYF